MALPPCSCSPHPKAQTPTPAPPQPTASPAVPRVPQYPPGSWQAQLESLMAVKEALDENNALHWWTRESGAYGKYCTWSGVTCNVAPNVQKIVIRGDNPEYTHYAGDEALYRGPYVENLQGFLPAAAALAGLGELTTINIEHQPHVYNTIPADWSKLTQLTGIMISNTSIHGALPASLGKLTNLTYLSLASNRLTGTLPDELKALTKLKSLDLRYNFLKGNVPASWSAMRRLKDALLGHNPGLQGCLPAGWDGQVLSYDFPYLPECR